MVGVALASLAACDRPAEQPAKMTSDQFAKKVEAVEGRPRPARHQGEIVKPRWLGDAKPKGYVPPPKPVPDQKLPASAAPKDPNFGAYVRLSFEQKQELVQWRVTENARRAQEASASGKSLTTVTNEEFSARAQAMLDGKI